MSRQRHSGHHAAAPHPAPAPAVERRIGSAFAVGADSPDVAAGHRAARVDVTGQARGPAPRLPVEVPRAAVPRTPLKAVPKTQASARTGRHVGEQAGVAPSGAVCQRVRPSAARTGRSSLAAQISSGAGALASLMNPEARPAARRLSQRLPTSCSATGVLAPPGLVPPNAHAGARRSTAISENPAALPGCPKCLAAVRSQVCAASLTGAGDAGAPSAAWPCQRRGRRPAQRQRLAARPVRP